MVDMYKQLLVGQDPAKAEEKKEEQKRKLEPAVPGKSPICWNMVPSLRKLWILQFWMTKTAVPTPLKRQQLPYPDEGGISSGYSGTDYSLYL